MLIIRAQLTIRADARALFLDHLRDLAESSRAEAGCTRFDGYEDVAAPNSFIVLQEWRDPAALDQHEQSSHVATFKANVGAMIVAREPTRVYMVTQVGGF